MWGYGSPRAVGHVQPWGHAHTGFCVHLGLRLTWGYGSGPHLWATGTPSPLSGRNKGTPTPPRTPPFYPQLLPTSPRSPYVPIPQHTPVSHLQPTSCLLPNSILLLQAACPYPPMCLYPPLPAPHTQSPIPPPGPSQTRYTSPTANLGPHRAPQSPAAPLILALGSH